MMSKLLDFDIFCQKSPGPITKREVFLLKGTVFEKCLFQGISGVHENNHEAFFCLRFFSFRAWVVSVPHPPPYDAIHKLGIRATAKVQRAISKVALATGHYTLED